MSPKLRSRLIICGLLVLLAISLAENLSLYARASRPLVQAGDEPLIEQTIGIAATAERTDPESIRAHMFPITFHQGGLTYVEWRAIDGTGYHGATYDRRGTLVGESSGME